MPTAPAVDNPGSTSSRPKTVPALGKDGSPVMFEGTELEDVEEWIDEFDSFCEIYDIAEKDRCRLLTKYVSHGVRSALKGIPQYDSKDWPGLKDELIRSYKSTALSVRWTTDDLREFTKESSQGRMRLPQDFEAYLREFRTISAYLVKRKGMSEEERGRMFWTGFPMEARDAVTMAMYRVEPNNASFVDSSKPYPFDLQVKGARNVFNAESFDARERFGISEKDVSEKRRNASAYQDLKDQMRANGRRVVPSFSYEPIKPTPLTEIAQKEGRTAWRSTGPTPNRDQQNRPERQDQDLDLIIDRLRNMSVNSSRYYSSYMSALREGFDIGGRVPVPLWGSQENPVYNDRNVQRNAASMDVCYYCNISGHKINACDLVREHMRKGWIERSSDGKLVFPGGEAIRGPYGMKRSLIVAERYNRRSPVGNNFIGVCSEDEARDVYGYDSDEEAHSYPIIDYEEDDHKFGTFRATKRMLPPHMRNSDWSAAASVRSKPQPRRTDAIRPGPAGKGEQGFRDKTARFADRVFQNPNTVPLQKPNRYTSETPKPYWDQEKRVGTKPAMTRRPQEQAETVPAPRKPPQEDVIMKDAKPKADKTGTPNARKSDFAREVDPYETVQRILERQVPLSMSMKELFAVSPLASSVVSKGTKITLGPASTSQKAVSFARGEDDSESEGEHLVMNAGHDDRISLSPSMKKAEFRSRGLIVFPGEIGGNQVRFMIDTGSEIDVMSRALYERFKESIPVRTDLRMFLKGVNGPARRMIGIMEDAEIKIGKMSFFSNMHLNEDGPDYVILGQPFVHQSKLEHVWVDGQPKIRLIAEDGVIEFPYPSDDRSSQRQLERGHSRTRHRAEKKENDEEVDFGQFHSEEEDF